ncbi:MAG: gliding motility-associated C-terminal domain-containing protein [Bacteroidota bacterium]
MLKAIKLLGVFLFLLSTPVFATTVSGEEVAGKKEVMVDDTIPPDTPLLDTVSVNNTLGKTVLGWEHCVATDVAKYFIYHQPGSGGIWILLDSVYIPATTYTDLTSIPQTGSEAYCIAAKDSSKKVSAMGVVHKSIYLSLLTLNACKNIFKLDWSAYINLSPSLAGYRVMMSENGGPYGILATTTPTATSFEHINLMPNSHYCYYVQAFDSLHTKMSTSNIQCAYARNPKEPQFVYLRYATVKDKAFVRVGFFTDTTAYVQRYTILRSEDGVNYADIGIVPHGNIYSNITFDDNSAKVDEKSYYYKVKVVDSCNVDTLTSNVGRTIFLDGTVDDYLYNYVTWNVYEDRYPQAYNVMREVEDYEPFTKIYSLVFNETQYKDDVENYTESGGRFRYTIQAPLYDIFNSSYAFADTVYSNEKILLQPPRLYVPNAFAPDGMNNIFKPIGVFTQKDNYKFIIYNRWGEKVYETTDYYEGWDGNFAGKKAESGAYAYYIFITNAYNKTFEKRGTVMLMR